MSSLALDPARQHSLRFLSGFYMPLLTAVAYYLGAQAAFLVGTLSDKIFAPLWPPNIILFCALLFSDPRRWPLFIAACVPAHFAAEYSVGMPIAQGTIAFASNCAVAILNAAGIRRFVGTKDWFSNLRNASLYIVVTVVAAPAAAAFGGAFVQFRSGDSVADYAHCWAQWYTSNALGAVTLGPVAIIALQSRLAAARKLLAEHPVEVCVTLAALIATSALAFNVTTKSFTIGYLPALLYLPLPLILWSAVRFGVGAACSAIVVVGSILLWNSLNGPNLFTASDPATNVLSLQIFLIGLAVPILLLSAAIEETRRAHAETRESEACMALAAASSNVGLWLYNYATKQFWATEHTRLMFGLPDTAPLEPKALLARIHPSDTAMASAALQAAIRDRAAIDIEFRVFTHDGSIRWIVARAPATGGDAGGEIRGTFVDVTKRKAAEEDAARKQQELVHLMRVSMLGELSSGLAHELTQPMTAILSNAQAGRMLLSGSSADLTELASILDDIISEDTRAGEVIHRLRMLLRKGESCYEAVDINETIESTLRLLHSEMVSRHTTVNYDLGTGLPMAKGDPIQLQQILLNLLLNAMDAVEDLLPSRRIILIITRLNGEGEIEVKIVDCGTGLTATQQQVFQPFFTTKRRGLGLGLSICASIAKSHGGTLSLQDNRGEGVTATFRLPVQQMEMSA